MYNGTRGEEMILFFAALMLLAVLGLRKADGGSRFYMSVEMTGSIKGFFLVMVFFTHIWTYTEFTNAYLDRPYQVLRQIGQCIVVMFLFYSGYGVMESIKGKGQAYVRQLPRQRFLKVLLQFDCAMLLFLACRYLEGARYSLKKVLLVFTGWDSVGNSNWYVFCILWLYLFTYASFRICKESHVKAALGVLLLSLAYIAVLRLLGKEDWWYNTALCYSWGMLFSLYRTRIEKLVNRNWGTWALTLLLFAAGYLSVYFIGNEHFAVYQWWVFTFAGLTVVFTMRIVIDSRPLQWLGRNLFGLYILQRLPMIMLKPCLLTGEPSDLRKYGYVILCFGITLVLAVAFRETAGRMVDKWL